MYYNTTNEVGEDLIFYELKATKQKDAVLELFQIHKKLSPSQCLRKYQIKTGKVKTPITSIRRAITDLTNEGSLCETPEKMYGEYGRNEHFWKLV